MIELIIPAVVSCVVAFFTVYFMTPPLIKYLHKKNLAVKDIHKPGNVMVVRPGGPAIIAGIILILIVVGWVLFLKNKKFAQKLISENTRQDFYKNQLNALKNSRNNTENDFETFNKLVRSFFKEYYKVSHSLAYSEIAKKFKNQKEIEYSKFCESMFALSYTGKKISQTDLNKLINYFSKLIDIKLG